MLSSPSFCTSFIKRVYITDRGCEIGLMDWAEGTGGNLHPITHLDVEQDWTRPQHFVKGVVLGRESFAASPRSEQDVFLPGDLTSTWTGATWTTDKAITITRMQVQANCSSRLHDERHRAALGSEGARLRHDPSSSK
jgi:hypothetical protein